MSSAAIGFREKYGELPFGQASQQFLRDLGAEMRKGTLADPCEDGMLRGIRKYREERAQMKCAPRVRMAPVKVVVAPLEMATPLRSRKSCDPPPKLNAATGIRQRKKASEVRQLVAASFDIKAERLIEGSNKPVVVLPRQVAMWLLMRELKFSSTRIGRYFGGMHHTTVLYAVKRIDDLCATDASLHEKVLNLAAQLKGGVR